MTAKTFWFVNHYASTPDQPSTSAFFFGRELVKRGHQVTFFASANNYYFQKRTKGRAWRLYGIEVVEGVRFCWLATSPISSRPVGRMLNMLSFALVALMVGLFERGRPDYVIGTCPHPLAGASAWLLSVLRRGTFIYEIRDIWPESLYRYETGLVWKIVIGFFARLQKFLYRRAYLIISVLPNIALYFKEIGVQPERTVHLPNCIELSRENGLETEIREAAGQPFRFYYVGGFSKYQGLDVLVEAAILAASSPSARPFDLHFVGTGSEKAVIEDLIRVRGASNIFVHPPVPRTEVQKVLAESDCNLFHLLDIGHALRYGISPNKLIEYLLSARPLIYAMPFHWNLIDDADVGYSAKCGDAQSLSAAMLAMLRTSVKQRLEMGGNARLVCNKFDVRTVVDDFIGALA